jgi:hypothetical protein
LLLLFNLNAAFMAFISNGIKRVLI